MDSHNTDSTDIIANLKAEFVGHSLPNADLVNGEVILTRDDGRTITVTPSEGAQAIGCMSSPQPINDLILISAPRERATINGESYGAERHATTHTIQAMADGMSLPLVTVASIDGAMFAITYNG